MGVVEAVMQDKSEDNSCAQACRITFVMGAVEAVMQDKSQDNSCARAEGSHMSCVRAEALQNSQNSCARAEALQKSQSSCVGLEKRSSSKRNDAVVRPGVEDPVEDDRIPAEAGAGMVMHHVNIPRL